MPNNFGGQHGLPSLPENPSPWEPDDHNADVPSHTLPETTPSLSSPPAAPIEDPPWNLADVLRLVVLAFVLIMICSVVALSVAIGRMGMQAANELARDPTVVVPAQLAAYLIVLA